MYPHALLLCAGAPACLPACLQALRRFGAFRRIELQPPLSLEALALAALKAQEAMGRWQVLGEGGGRWGAVEAGQ